jgi:squalene-associated FAD-dependent desaturase
MVRPGSTGQLMPRCYTPTLKTPTHLANVTNPSDRFSFVLLAGFAGCSGRPVIPRFQIQSLLSMNSSGSSSESRRVVVVGGGLAGLAASAVLGRRGFHVTLFESRPRLGGRASSFADRESGDSIDNCQHVSMGCCANFRQFSEQLGFADLFATQRELTFVGPPPQTPLEPRSVAKVTQTFGSADRNSVRVSPPQAAIADCDLVRFAAANLPAPLHLGPNLLRMPWFSLGEKFAIALGMRRLARERCKADRPFADWLSENGQSAVVQRRFWHVVLVSALSESLDRISLRQARKVFVDGFLRHRTGWEVAVPTVPLDQIYSSRVLPALRELGVDVCLGAGVERVLFDDERLVGDKEAVGVELRGGERLDADDVVLSVPHWRVLALLPESLADSPSLRGITQLEAAAISSVHLWYDRPLTDLPHAALIDRISQWVFHRSRLGNDCHDRETDSAAGANSVVATANKSASYLQVVISNSRDVLQRGSDELIATVDAELREVWPGNAKLLRGRLVTEHRAVFSPLPGVDLLRPEQQSPIRNVQLAGDWTQTGWPSTMEGAVRSGYLAAQNILRQHGIDDAVLADDLPTSWLTRWLFPV